MRFPKMGGILMLLLLQAPAGFSATKAIRFGKLVDGTGKVLTNAIVAVEGDPLKDINVVINNVRWVMKGGTVVSDKTAGK